MLQETETPNKCLTFSQKKAVLIFQEAICISGNGGPKTTFIFLEVSYTARKIKKNALKKLLIFQEMELFNLGLKKKFLYIRKEL